MADTFRQCITKAVGGALTGSMTLPSSQGGPGATQAQVVTESNNVCARRRIIVPFTDGGTAGTAFLESPFAWCESWLSNGWYVVAVEFIPQVTLAVAATDYFTYTVSARTSGGAATTIATITSNTGGTALTAFTAVAMTSTVLPFKMAAGTDVLTHALVKTGAGKAIASATGASYVAITVDEW